MTILDNVADLVSRNIVLTAKEKGSLRVGALGLVTLGSGHVMGYVMEPFNKNRYKILV